MVAFFVVFTFVAFILADAAVQWAGARKTKLAPVALGVKPIASFPRGLFASPGHTWLGLESSGLVRVGMDAFAGFAIGRIDGVELPEEGRRVTRGEPLFTVCQGTRKAVFSAPVDGVVTAVNREASADLKSHGADPYRSWLCALEPQSIADSIRKLFIGDEAADWLRSETRRFLDLLTSRPLQTAEAGAVLADGGQPAPGALEEAGDDVWKAFSEEFLGSKS